MLVFSAQYMACTYSRLYCVVSSGLKLCYMCYIHTGRRQEACAPNLGRVITEEKIDDKKEGQAGGEQEEGEGDAPAVPAPAQTAKSKKNKKVVFKVQPGSWVADAKAWSPNCVQWGQQVAELYGHTEVY